MTKYHQPHSIGLAVDWQTQSPPTSMPLQLLPATVKTHCLAHLQNPKIEWVHIDQLTSNIRMEKGKAAMNPALSRAWLPQQMLPEPIHEY